MKRLLCLILVLGLRPLWASPEGGPGVDYSAAETRALRELQFKAFGKTKLATEAPKGEGLLALAELGAYAAAPPPLPGESGPPPELGAPFLSAPSPSFNSGSSGSSSSSGLGSSDYDALHALLERYRDDLLKLGLSSSELDAQIQTLHIRAEELKERLDKLKPKDGLKFHGRVYAAFSDMHLYGPAGVAGIVGVPIYLNGPLPAKVAGQGERFQAGLVHAEVGLTGTRGPMSTYAQIDAVSAWGLGSGEVNFRRVWLQLRLPVTLEVGTLDVSLSPLTLWRNDQSEPFEPQPFAGRRQRLERDMLLVDNKWNIKGARLSTDVLLFGAQSLELESISAFLGIQDLTAPVYQYYPATAATVLYTHFATYMEGWRASLPFADKAFVLSYYGNLFWDVKATSTSTAGQFYQEQNSLVQSARSEFKKGFFRAEVEYAIAGYAYPISVAASVQPIPVVQPITGTALTYAAGVEGSMGHIKAFGRTVSSGFNSAGAQGRTQDADYEFLGPFVNDDIYVGSDGRIGLDLPPAGSNTPPRMKMNFGSRFNDRLIPPGTQTQLGYASPWNHLLRYSYREDIDPYGAATPNRAGFGVEGAGNFFKGGLRPIGSYEAFQQIDPLPLFAPFSYTRMRGGAIIDLKPIWNFPLKLSAGYESTDTHNSQTNTVGVSYALTSTMMDLGAEYAFGENMGLGFGMRQAAVQGITDRFNYGTNGGRTFAIMGYSFWWKPLETMVFDLTFSQQTNGGELPTYALTVDEGLARMTLSF